MSGELREAMDRLARARHIVFTNHPSWDERDDGDGDDPDEADGGREDWDHRA